MLENKMVVDWYWNDEWYWADTEEEERVFEEICSVDEEVENLETMETANESTLKKLVEKIKNIVPITAEWDNTIDAIVYTY